MHTLAKRAYGLAMCLSAMAGYVDAIGFLELGGYFVSFMSGNSTQLAVSFATGRPGAVVGGVLLFFVLGAMLGSFARHGGKGPIPAVRVLALVTALLACGAISHAMGHNLLSMAMIALAMGAVNAVFQRDGDVVIGLTYMTGTLVKLGQRLAAALLGGARFAWLPFLLLWLSLILGGMTGALSFHFLGLHSLWLAVAWSACLTAAAHTMRRFLP